MGLNTDSLLKYFLCYTVTGLKSWVVFSPFEISTLNCRNFALLARLPKRPINHNFCSQMWLIEQLHIKLGFLPYLWRCLHSLQTLQAYVEGCVLFRTQLILKRKNSPWKLKISKFSHGDTNADKLSCLSFLIFDICFVHPIFSSFGFWYFGHFSYVIFFPFFSILPCKM